MPWLEISVVCVIWLTARSLAALEAVRSRRAQLSALQSILSAYRAEAELAR
jgi:hypothetical protein